MRIFEKNKPPLKRSEVRRHFHHGRDKTGLAAVPLLSGVLLLGFLRGPCVRSVSEIGAGCRARRHSRGQNRTRWHVYIHW